MTARHLRLALALILSLAGATKRPRDGNSRQSLQSSHSASSNSSNLRQGESASSSTLKVVKRADPVDASVYTYFLKRAIQMAGCLFSDAAACSGGFDDPIRHAAILLNNVFAKVYPEHGPFKPLKANLSSVEQLRDELDKAIQLKRNPNYKVDDAGVDELQFIAAKQLIHSTLRASVEESLAENARSTISAWSKNKGFSEHQMLGVDEVFVAAEKNAARFDRGVFVWPTKGSSDPEERLYAAAVVVMCRRLGVRPVSVFLITHEFGSSLPSSLHNKGIGWRRPTFQVIARAANKTVKGLDLAESCRGLVEKLGISEQLEFVPSMGRHRHEPKSQSRSMPTPTEPAEPPMPLVPLAAPLPTALRETFGMADRLLLVRSIQLARLLLDQPSADQKDFYLQASIVLAHLLKLNDHGVPSELIEPRPGTCFTPLDLLRVVAEADRRPDLGAVSTVGDVMVAAAQTIFRHLYLALPITLLTKVDAFNVIKSPESYYRHVATLVDYLVRQKAPYSLSDSSVFRQIYEASDAILWTAFRILSKRRGNPDEAFALCTREMSEKIPIARQYTYYLIPAILRKVLESSTKSIEAAVLDLLPKIAPVAESLGGLQAPSVVPRAPGITPQAPVATPKIVTRADVLANMSDQADRLLSRVYNLSSQYRVRRPEDNTNEILSKALLIIDMLFPGTGTFIQSLRDIPSMVLRFLPTDLAKAGELTSVNRLAATSQLHTLDAKLKRDKIPFSDTDHVTVLLDALVALHLLQQGAVFRLASFPRTRTSDIGAEEKDGLARLLVAALFVVTLMWPARENFISNAFSELTKMLTSAVEATTSD